MYLDISGLVDVSAFGTEEYWLRFGEGDSLELWRRNIRIVATLYPENGWTYHNYRPLDLSEFTNNAQAVCLADLWIRNEVMRLQRLTPPSGWRWGEGLLVSLKHTCGTFYSASDASEAEAHIAVGNEYFRQHPEEKKLESE